MWIGSGTVSLPSSGFFQPVPFSFGGSLLADCSGGKRNGIEIKKGNQRKCCFFPAWQFAPLKVVSHPGRLWRTHSVLAPDNDRSPSTPKWLFKFQLPPKQFYYNWSQVSNRREKRTAFCRYSWLSFCSSSLISRDRSLNSCCWSAGIALNAERLKRDTSFTVTDFKYMYK